MSIFYLNYLHYNLSSHIRTSLITINCYIIKFQFEKSSSTIILYTTSDDVIKKPLVSHEQIPHVKFRKIWLFHNLCLIDIHDEYLWNKDWNRDSARFLHEKKSILINKLFPVSFIKHKDGSLSTSTKVVFNTNCYSLHDL